MMGMTGIYNECSDPLLLSLLVILVEADKFIGSLQHEVQDQEAQARQDVDRGVSRQVTLIYQHIATFQFLGQPIQQTVMLKFIFFFFQDEFQ